MTGDYGQQGRLRSHEIREQNGYRPKQSLQDWFTVDVELNRSLLERWPAPRR